MRFTETKLPGAWIVEPERLEDARGFFARTFCRREFLAHGLDPDLVQCSLSFNRRRGTLRGMHYQAPPHEEGKLVRCTAGAVWDVVLDLRPDSRAYLQHAAVRLDADNRLALYVPPGVAHGFLTLTDDAELFYQMSVSHHQESARGVRWDDPAFGIDWPAAPVAIAERDAGYPDFQG
jgi:dTDP-4-dehydrorhamnose 3,5-epimerase